MTLRVAADDIVVVSLRRRQIEEILRRMRGAKGEAAREVRDIMETARERMDKKRR